MLLWMSFNARYKTQIIKSLLFTYFTVYTSEWPLYIFSYQTRSLAMRSVANDHRILQYCCDRDIVQIV